MGKYFYDVHTHAIRSGDLSLLGYFSPYSTLTSMLTSWMSAPSTSVFRKRFTLKRFKNAFIPAEISTGEYFLLFEECVAGRCGEKEKEKAFFKGGKLSFAGNTYEKFVITPLTIDFDYAPGNTENLHYNRFFKRHVEEQARNIFEGARYYLEHSEEKIFEIYPFLGINPANHDIDDLEERLERYFKGYNGTNRQLKKNLGRFWDMDDVGSGWFAGIKVYPPLGFNAWPDEDSKPAKPWLKKGYERKKAELLYEFAQKKQIPITSHCDEDGYFVGDISEAVRRTSPSGWEKVLGNYPRLKINFAHYATQNPLFGCINRTGWIKKLKKYMCKYPSVFADISYRAASPEFYTYLRDNIKSIFPWKRNTLLSRTLYGSDFAVNLLVSDSYNNYLAQFEKTEEFSSKEKDLFCSGNPEKFLFKE